MSENGHIKIDKTVPFPTERTPRGTYPFADMEIGDSFFAPGVKSATMSAQTRYHGLKLNRKFIMRAVIEDGIKGTRTWRIE